MQIKQKEKLRYLRLRLFSVFKNSQNDNLYKLKLYNINIICNIYVLTILLP